MIHNQLWFGSEGNMWKYSSSTCRFQLLLMPGSVTLSLLTCFYVCIWELLYMHTCCISTRVHMLSMLCVWVCVCVCVCLSVRMHSHLGPQPRVTTLGWSERKGHEKGESHGVFHCQHSLSHSHTLTLFHTQAHTRTHTHTHATSHIDKSTHARALADVKHRLPSSLSEWQQHWHLGKSVKLYLEMSWHTHAQTDTHKQADTWLTAAASLKKTAVSMEERLVCWIVFWCLLARREYI